MKKITLALLVSFLSVVPAIGQSVESNLIDAVTLYGNGQAVRARDILQTLSKAAPENDAVWYYLAQTQWQTSAPEQAEASLKKAIALDSTNFWYRRLLGRMYLSQNKIDEGEGQYEALVKAFPEWLKGPKHRSPTGRHAFSTCRLWTADEPLLASGLLGPVRLQVVDAQ